MRTATGEEAEVKRHVSRLIFKGLSEFLQDFLVADIVDKIILGLDFMSDNGFTNNLKEKLLKFSNVQIPFSRKENQRANIKKKCCQYYLNLDVPPIINKGIVVCRLGEVNTCSVNTSNLEGPKMASFVEDSIEDVDDVSFDDARKI